MLMQQAATAEISLAAWEQRGARLDVGRHSVFLVDLPAAGAEGGDPLLILHGFPTCSFDWHAVVDHLRQTRRVVLLDYLGFGLSDKPDQRYTIELHADTVTSVVAELGLDRVALISHDMGNTVGAELLARSLAGELEIEITARVLTNGNLYIDMHPLLPGQRVLLSLPDAPLELPRDKARRAFLQSLTGLLARPDAVPEVVLHAEWQLASHLGGHRLLPRTIRYLEDRMDHDRRFSEAIEAHPARLATVWGDADPVASLDVPRRLRAAAPSSTGAALEGVGHYPMLEAPKRFAGAVLGLL